MSNYNIAINWAGKDALSDSDPDKVISGDDFNTEFTTVKTAVNTKADLNGSATESFSATTATAGTNTTQVATTAFVGNATSDMAKLSVDQAWTGSQRGTIVTDNDGSFDLDGGNNFSCTPTGATTLTFTNIPNGQTGLILLVNTGGNTMSAHTNTKVGTNLLNTISTAGTYLLSYFSDGTDVYLTYSEKFA